ncbi:putative HNH endonuclease [metagenome]|uniref:Putative HNH endonuclease n=1 Tax=metagenome TaxID=256318 RepID=A0A2P2C617_9ZZZZ
MTTALAPTAPDLDTPASVLEQARELRAIADRAEARILALAGEWADLHPAPPGGDTAFDDDRLPAVGWDAPAEFALAVGMSHDAGARLIHHALHLRHRMPSIWARAMNAGHPGGLQVWRARRIAEHTIHQSPAVTDHLDHTLAPLAHKIGPITTTRLIDEAVLRCHPTKHEAARLAALDTRHVTIRPADPTNPAHTGIGYLEADADLVDLLDLDTTLSALAAILADHGCTESLDVRRSLALGVLADPQHAAQLLTAAASDTPTKPRKQVVLYVHLSEAAITGAATATGVGAVGRLENGGHQPILASQIRTWCSRTDTAVRIQPVIDLNHHTAVTHYEVPDRLREHTQLRDHHCVFPHCTRPARRCDHDHITPYRPDNTGGRTCTCNLAPLCRRHHRLKTHTRWRYRALNPGNYLWTSPHGHTYHVDHTGTHDHTPPPSPP